MRKFLAILMAAVVLGSCTDKIDDDILISNGLPIDGLQQVPAKMVSGNGTIDAAYNKNLKTLYYTVKWNSLTGAPTNGTFGIYGPAAKGYRSIGLLQAFTQFTAANAGTFSGSVFIDGVLFKEEDLISGQYYVNIPTAANPFTALNPAMSGEIRGQISGLK